MTTTQRKEYLKSGGSKCPYCGSGDIEGQGSDYEGASISQEVGCNSCNMQWVDVYSLADVIPHAHNENEPQDELPHKLTDKGEEI